MMGVAYDSDYGNTTAELEFYVEQISSAPLSDPSPTGLADAPCDHPEAQSPAANSLPALQVPVLAPPHRRSARAHARLIVS